MEMQWSPGFLTLLCPVAKKLERHREKEMSKKNLKPNNIFIEMQENVFFYCRLQKKIISYWNFLRVWYFIHFLPILRRTITNKVRKKEKHSGSGGGAEGRWAFLCRKTERSWITNRATKTIKIFLCNEACHPLGGKSDVGWE